MRFDRWKTLSDQKFDEGGQGVLFLVSDMEAEFLGDYVLKRLKNPKRQNRFEIELKSMERLANSARVVRLIDSGAIKSASKDYYVMERGEGSLEQLAPSGGYEAEAACQLFREIVLGVAEVHAARIVHRDLKPANIILFSGQPKIGDLGLSLLTDVARVTPTEEAVGPRYYMAPELEHGRNLDVDGRADIYSLGKLLYWLLSGGVHLPRERFREPVYRLRERNEEPAYDVFDAIFDQTLTLYPRDRFTDVGGLLTDFDECVEKFLRHPDHTFRQKLKDTSLDEPATATLIRKLSQEEMEALWNWATKKKLVLSLDVLLALGSSIGMLDINRWLTEIDNIPQSRSPDAIKLLAETLFLSSSHDSSSFLANPQSAALREALRYGVMQGSADMRASVASNWSKLLLFQSDLISHLLAKGNLPISAKRALAVDVFREEFDGQFGVMKELLRAAEGDADVIEAVVAGLIKSREEEALALVEDTLANLGSKSLRDAVLRAFAWSEPKRSQLERLVKSPRIPAETKELLRVLGDLVVEATKKKRNRPGKSEE